MRTVPHCLVMTSWARRERMRQWQFRGQINTAASTASALARCPSSTARTRQRHQGQQAHAIRCRSDPLRVAWCRHSVRVTRCAIAWHVPSTAGAGVSFLRFQPRIVRHRQTVHQQSNLAQFIRQPRQRRKAARGPEHVAGAHPAGGRRHVNALQVGGGRQAVPRAGRDLAAGGASPEQVLPEAGPAAQAAGDVIKCSSRQPTLAGRSSHAYADVLNLRDATPLMHVQVRSASAGIRRRACAAHRCQRCSSVCTYVWRSWKCRCSRRSDVHAASSRCRFSRSRHRGASSSSAVVEGSSASVRTRTRASGDGAADEVYRILHLLREFERLPAADNPLGCVPCASSEGGGHDPHPSSQ